jgi:hypothetical protein
MQHRQKNKRYLTGSTLDQYCQFFRIDKNILRDKTILEVGVGLGIATQELGAMTVKLDVLDISRTAISNVIHSIRCGFLSDTILNDNEYDYAFSYFVSQHMDDDELSIQLFEVIRSLKSSGTFYLQWVDAEGDNGQDFEAQSKGGILRSVEDMHVLVGKAGGELEIVHIVELPTVRSYGGKIRRV